VRLGLFTFIILLYLIEYTLFKRIYHENVESRMKTLRENMNLTPQAVSSYLDIPSKDLLNMGNDNKNITLSILNKP